MGLETGTYIDDFVTTNPLGTDDRSTADDHLRLIKLFIKNTFPQLTGAMTATQAELNRLDGITASTAELNKLDGFTGGVTQLNRLNSIAGNGPLDAFPSGTDMLFYQSAAPTGWTRNTTAALNDHALRIMTSGTWVDGTHGTRAFSTQFAEGFGGVNFTLLETHIPSHNHGSAGAHGHSATASGSSGGPSERLTRTESSNSDTTVSNAIQSAGAHTHTSFGGSSAHAHNVNLGVKYLDMIIASKN